MKTIKEIDQEISDALKSINKDSTKNEVAKVKRDITFLQQIKLYLETNPRSKFIQSQIELVQKRIEKMDDDYYSWTVGRNLSKYANPKDEFHNQMGLSIMKAQIKALKYILE